MPLRLVISFLDITQSWLVRYTTKQHTILTNDALFSTFEHILRFCLHYKILLYSVQVLPRTVLFTVSPCYAQVARAENKPPDVSWHLKYMNNTGTQDTFSRSYDSEGSCHFAFNSRRFRQSVGLFLFLFFFSFHEAALREGMIMPLTLCRNRVGSLEEWWRRVGSHPSVVPERVRTWTSLRNAFTSTRSVRDVGI